MHELLQAFVLGNAAILTNVCMLPLYPGLIAFLAGTAQHERGRRALRWLGFLVLAGVLSLMLAVGWLLYVLQASFAQVLPWLLPVIYTAVLGLGVLMLAGRNPFRRFSLPSGPSQDSLRHSPYLGAYMYGLLLGPMTLPCAGPIVVSAFLLGAGSTQQLAGSLAYFLAFGLGFGWPLVVLPLLALPMQRHLIHWTVRYDRVLTTVSGLLLVGIALLGFVVEVRPNL